MRAEQEGARPARASICVAESPSLSLMTKSKTGPRLLSAER